MHNDSPVTLPGNVRTTGRRSDRDLFDAVSNRYRRCALAFLAEGPTSPADLATRVAAWEHGTHPGRLADAEVDAIHAALHHVHLPKLEEAGLVERTAGGNVAAVDPAIVDRHGFSEMIGRDDPGREAGVDRLFDVLSSPFRRTLLVSLFERGGDAFPLSVTAIAETLRGDGHADDPGSATDGRWDDLVVSLHHVHLPGLSEAGFLAYDADERVVRLERPGST